MDAQSSQPAGIAVTAGNDFCVIALSFFFPTRRLAKGMCCPIPLLMFSTAEKEDLLSGTGMDLP